MMAALVLCGCAHDKPLTFVAGSYETTYNGHNGPISIKTTFSDSCVTKIEVLSQEEMQQLVADLFACPMAETAPSGKKIITIVKPEELLKN